MYSSFLQLLFLWFILCQAFFAIYFNSLSPRSHNCFVNFSICNYVCLLYNIVYQLLLQFLLSHDLHSDQNYKDEKIVSFDFVLNCFFFHFHKIASYFNCSPYFLLLLYIFRYFYESVKRIWRQVQVFHLIVYCSHRLNTLFEWYIT